jgi:hypothetical protein
LKRCGSVVELQESSYCEPKTFFSFSACLALFHSTSLLLSRVLLSVIIQALMVRFAYEQPPKKTQGRPQKTPRLQRGGSFHLFLNRSSNSKKRQRSQDRSNPPCARTNSHEHLRSFCNSKTQKQLVFSFPFFISRLSLPLKPLTFFLKRKRTG